MGISQSKATFAANEAGNIIPYTYFHFQIGEDFIDTLWDHLNKVIELKMIDTAILKK